MTQRPRASLGRRRSAAGFTSKPGVRAREPTGSADGRRRGDRHPRRSQPRPRRLRAAAARQSPHRVRRRRRGRGRRRALGARPVRHHGHRPAHRGHEVGVLPRDRRLDGGDRVVRRLRRRRAPPVVPARTHGGLRLHAGRQCGAAAGDPPRAEGRPHADGRHGRLGDGHDALVAARPPERDRRAHAHRVRVPLLRRLSRLPPPHPGPRRPPRSDDRAARCGDLVRRDHRAQGRHQLQHALPLPGRLRLRDHRREPVAAAGVPAGREGAAALPHAHGRSRRGARARAQRGLRAPGSGGE